MNSFANLIADKPRMTPPTAYTAASVNVPLEILLGCASDGEKKNKHAVALGRLGGLKGGPARAKKLSKKRRKEIAIKAAKARWRSSD